MKAIKIKTKSGKAVHRGFAYLSDGVATSVCPKVKNSDVLEVSPDAEITCKYCLSVDLGMDEASLTLYSHHPAQETTPTETQPAPVQTIRISADMEDVLNRDARISTSLQTACAAGVSWKAGKLYVTRAGRDALLWYLEMRAEVAQEALTDGRPVYPARRALWHAAVKLNRQASYMLAA